MTKIIRRTSDKVVLFAGDTLELTADHATNGELVARDTTTANAELVDGGILPADWQGGHYTYNGAWARTADGTAAQSARLADARAEMWERIKAHRDQLSDEGGYKVNVSGVDKWFHSDTKSKAQQTGLVIAGSGIPAGLQWKTMDGTFVTMTQALAGQIFQAAMAQEQAIFARAEQHRQAMLAAADPLTYDFSGGWPVTFTG